MAWLKCSTWSPDGKLISSGHFGGDVLLRFPAEPDKELVISTKRSAVSSLAFSNDSKQLAVASDDGTVDLYDVSNLIRSSRDAELGIETIDPPEFVSTLKAHAAKIEQSCFFRRTPHGSLLATRWATQSCGILMDAIT